MLRVGIFFNPAFPNFRFFIFSKGDGENSYNLLGLRKPDYQQYPVRVHVCILLPTGHFPPHMTFSHHPESQDPDTSQNFQALV